VAPFPLEADLPLDNDYYSRFYIRINCSDGLGIIRAVGDAAEQCSVSIHAILQNPILSYTDMDFVVTTETVRLSQVQRFAAIVEKMSFAREKPLFLPII
jgi:hypothetical protein